MATRGPSRSRSEAVTPRMPPEGNGLAVTLLVMNPGVPADAGRLASLLRRSEP